MAKVDVKNAYTAMFLYTRMTDAGSCSCKLGVEPCTMYHALSAVHSCSFRDNDIGGAYSRKAERNLSYLFSQVQGAASGRLAIPRKVLTLLVEQQLDWTSPAWTRLFGNCFLPG